MKCPWTYASDGSALAVDHISVETTADGGSSRWVRDAPFEGVWEALSNFIYIDGVAGDDENLGFYETFQSAPAAIKTHAELSRRLGAHGAWKIGSSVVIQYIAYPSDPLDFDVDFSPNGLGAIVVKGAPLTPQASGTFSAVTVRDRSTNTPYDVADGSVDTTDDVTRRIRITSGTRAGACAWVAKSTGPGLRRTSEWNTWSPLTFTSAVTPEAGDSYVVESSASQLLIARIDVRSFTGGSFSTDPPVPTPSIIFNDVDFRPPVDGAVPLFRNAGCYLTFFDCLFVDGEWNVKTDALSGDATSSYTYFANCCTNGAGGNVHFTGGSFVDNYIDAGLFFGGVFARQAAGVTIDYDALFQEGDAPVPAAIESGQVRVVTLGVMDWGGYGGVIVGDGVVGCLDRSESGYMPAIWGTTAAAGAVGIDVRAGGTLRYVPGTQFTITGPGGDFQMAEGATARGWNEALGSYTAPLACTWANLAGALGGNAHAVASNAHVYPNPSGTGQAQP
ncbi:MAG TPA: hypothetical protein VMI75_06925 [Polyangiaceae bacterium]|nr:hypothetical protein [Polyangiaceae bacterium]